MPFLPPDSIPEEWTCIQVSFPNAPDYIYAVVGALAVLESAYNWESGYGVTPQQNADLFVEVLRNINVGEGCETVDCNAVLDCFNDPDFLQGVIDRIGDGADYPGGGTTLTPQPGFVDYQRVDLSDICNDDDALYGIAYQVVALYDTVVQDMVEILIQLSEALDLISTIADAVPVIGAIPELLVELADWIIDGALAGYTAGFNQSRHEEIACYVYCQLAEDCEITMENIALGYRKYMQQAVPPPLTGSITNFIRYLINLPDTLEDTYVASFHYWVMKMHAHGSDFFSASHRLLEIARATADPIPAPQDCVACPEQWCEYGGIDDNFVASMWRPTGNASAGYINGEGWGTGAINKQAMSLESKPDLIVSAGDTFIYWYEVKFDRVPGGYFTMHWTNLLGQQTTQQFVGVTEGRIEINGYPTRISVHAVNNKDENGNYIDWAGRLIYTRIRGEGINRYDAFHDCQT